MWLLTYTVCLSVLFFEGADRIVAGAQDKISSNYFFPTKCEEDTISLNLEPTLDYSEASDAEREISDQPYNEVNDPTEKSQKVTEHFEDEFSEPKLAGSYTTETFTPTEGDYGVQLNSHNESEMPNSIKSKMATTLLESSDEEDGIRTKQVPVLGLEEESEEAEETLSYTSPIQILEDDFKESQLYTSRATESVIGLEDEAKYSINGKQVQQLISESNSEKLQEGDDQSVTHTVNIEFMFRPVTPGILSQVHVQDENIVNRKGKERLVASDSDKVAERSQKQSSEKHRHGSHERGRGNSKSTTKHHRTTGRKGLPVSSGRGAHKGKGKGGWLMSCNLPNQPKIMDGTSGTQKWNSKSLATSERLLDDILFETTEAATFPVFVTEETEEILMPSYLITAIPTYTVQENSDVQKSDQGNVPECYKIIDSMQGNTESANVPNSSGQPNLNIDNEQLSNQGNLTNIEVNTDTKQQRTGNTDGQINKKVNDLNGDKNDATGKKVAGNVNGQVINQGKALVGETTEGIASDNNSPELQNRRVVPNKKPQPLPDGSCDNDGQNSAQVEVKIKVGFGSGSSTFMYSTFQGTTAKPRTLCVRPRRTTCKTTCSTAYNNILEERVHLLKCLCNTTECTTPSTTMFNINKILCPSTRNKEVSCATNAPAHVFNTPTSLVKDDTHSSTEPWYWCCFKKAMTTVKVQKDSGLKVTDAAQRNAEAKPSAGNYYSSTSQGPQSSAVYMSQNQTNETVGQKSSTMGMQPRSSSAGYKRMSTNARGMYQETFPYRSSSLAQEKKKQESNIVAPASNGQETLSNGEDSSYNSSTTLMSPSARPASGSAFMSQLPTTPFGNKQTVASSSTRAETRPQEQTYVSMITVSTPQRAAYASQKEVSATPQATPSSSQTGKLSHTLKQKLQAAINYVTQPVRVESDNPSNPTSNGIVDEPPQYVSPLISPPYAPPEIHKKLSDYKGNQFQSNILENEFAMLGTKKSYEDLLSTVDVRYVNSDNIVSTLKYEEEIKTLLRNGHIKNPSIHESVEEGKQNDINYNRPTEGELKQIPIKHQRTNKNSIHTLKDQETKRRESKESNQWIANIMTKNQKAPVRVHVKFIYDPTAERPINSSE